MRRLQKAVKELRSENDTLLEAWAKTEGFLEEITNGVPLEELMRYNKLPKKAIRVKDKKVRQNDNELREEAREKLAKWRKENL